MTASPNADWGDDRLAAAFAARAARSPVAPASLGDGAIDRVRAIDQGIRPTRMLMALSVAAFAILLGGSTILLQLGRAPSIPVAQSAAPTPAPPRTTSPPISPVLEELGEAITVSEALAILDSGDAAREMIVAGYLSSVPIAYCPFDPGPKNPTRPTCPETFQGLMERPEGPGGTFPPGPALRPSFALVDAPSGPLGRPDSAAPVHVELVGHFHDRRSRHCPEPDRQACEQTFVVDRVASIDGVEQPVGTVSRTDSAPLDLEAGVDSLIRPHAPGAVVVSRQLLTLENALGVEPALLHDEVLPHIADQSRLAWLVTTVDLVDGVPRARTFMLLDGSNWFAEITPKGASMLDRIAAAPTSGPRPTIASPDPAAFASAPASVLGMPVLRVAEVTLRRGEQNQSIRDEFAIQAWYLAPRPGSGCAVQQGVEMLRPPCDEARHWLLDDPRQYGNTFGQLRIDPDFAPVVLNPLVPSDVPFTVGETWRGDTPTPQPVIVLGHFNDDRVDAYHGSAYFVVDAFAWTRDAGLASLDRVVRLTNAASDDVAEVTARIARLRESVPLATWASVVDGSEISFIDYEFGGTPREFVVGPPVWIVRQLVEDEADGRHRRAVVTAYTVDGSDRVWLTSCPDCAPELATSLDVSDPDGATELVRVFDLSDRIVDARVATGIQGANWHAVSGNDTCGTEVAQAGALNAVVIRWRGAMAAPRWDLTVFEWGDGSIYVHPSRPEAGCGSEDVIRRIVLEFDHPVDVRRFIGNSCCG